MDKLASLRLRQGWWNVTRRWLREYASCPLRSPKISSGCKPFPFGNSFGHLVLHLTGNLNYYIGTQIAGTGYVRDRDREFTETQHLPKEEVLQRFR